MLMVDLAQLLMNLNIRFQCFSRPFLKTSRNSYIVIHN